MVDGRGGGETWKSDKEYLTLMLYRQMFVRILSLNVARSDGLTNSFLPTW